MSASAPPGYASGRPRETLPIGGVSSWAFATGSLLILAGYELVRTLPQLYLDGSTRLTAELCGVGCSVLGLAAARRVRAPAEALPSALGVTALLAGSGAALAFTAFPYGPWLAGCVLALALCGGLAAGFGAGCAIFGPGRVLAEVGAVAWLLHPLRAALGAVAWLGLLASFPLLGALRRGGLLGALLAVAALLFHRWSGLLGVAIPSRGLATALPALTGVVVAAALFGANQRVPLDEIARHAGDIVFTAHGPRGRHVITRVQDGFALFSDGLLLTTSNDASRYAESFAHPALSAAKGARSVLVLGSTTGALEREVLRWRSVERVTSVATDAQLSRLSESSAWLSPLGAGALSDARVTRVEAEAMKFVLRAAQRYHVILADLGDPSSYRDGKHFTRFFFERLRERLVTGGILALPLTSPLRTPETHASIVRTLEAAGWRITLYRAPLPTLGEWGFALARLADTDSPSPHAPKPVSFPAGTTFVTEATMPGLFALPANAKLPEAPVSRLFDQPVVEAYQREEQALSD